jgi:hypothetical protein
MDLTQLSGEVFFDWKKSFEKKDGNGNGNSGGGLAGIVDVVKVGVVSVVSVVSVVDVVSVVSVVSVVDVVSVVSVVDVVNASGFEDSGYAGDFHNGGGNSKKGGTCGLMIALWIVLGFTVPSATDDHNGSFD